METIFDDDESSNDIDIEEMIYEMSSSEFMVNEIKVQIDNLLDSTKRDYVDFYIEKYKILKKNYKDVDENKLDELKYNKDVFLENILDLVTEKFDLNVIEDDISNRLVKTIYNFFIRDYEENLYIFFMNYINKNKKNIISEIKRLKKTRDISSLASKNKYSNPNDAIILNNINFILFDLIPSIDLSDEFIDYITESDDDIINVNIQKYIEKEKLEINDDSYLLFLEPFLNKEDGYSDIISKIVIELSEKLSLNDIKLLKDKDE